MSRDVDAEIDQVVFRMISRDTWAVDSDVLAVVRANPYKHIHEQQVWQVDDNEQQTWLMISSSWLSWKVDWGVDEHTYDLQRWWAEIETMSSVDDEQMINSIDQQQNRLKRQMMLMWQWAFS